MKVEHQSDMPSFQRIGNFTDKIAVAGAARQHRVQRMQRAREEVLSVSGCEHHPGSSRFGNHVSEGFYVELISSLFIPFPCRRITV